MIVAIVIAAAFGLPPAFQSGEPATTPVTEALRMDYFSEAQAIWRSEVPASGQSETVRGELLRAVEKLRDESMRNGAANWDAGFDILLAYLVDHLKDPEVFDAATRARTAAILDRLKSHKEPVLDDEPFDELADRVVDWSRHYGPVAHTRNPALLR